MYRRHGNKLVWVFLGCDLVVTAGAWVAAYGLRFSLWHAPYGVPELADVLHTLPLALIWAAIAYKIAGLYEIHRLRQLPREFGVILRAVILLGLLLVTSVFYSRPAYQSRLALTLFVLLDAVALAISRRAIWQLLKWLRRHGLNHGRALIVGTGRHGHQVAQAIIRNYWTGLEVVGFVDRPGRPEPKLLPRLGDIDELGQIAQAYDIDHVFIALPATRYGELPQVYRALADLLVEVQLVPDVPELAGMRLRMLEIDGLSFLSLRSCPHDRLSRCAKRLLDLVLATAALVMLGPLMLAIAVAIRLTSPGPILYRQRRVGYKGREFDMLKFRTMRVDAEEKTGPVWASPNDPRCTPLGRFLRRWSLDELPQLFNVLAGDMSLVGPRPERRVFVQRFSKLLPTYNQRHSVPAGMTGLAQIKGWRGKSSLRHRLAQDLYYVNHWSLWLDLKILLLTPLFGFRHRNAY